MPFYHGERPGDAQPPRKKPQYTRRGAERVLRPVHVRKRTASNRA